MKHKKTELDVDFIGGEGSQTKEEEKKISEFLIRKKNFEHKAIFARPRTR